MSITEVGTPQLFQKSFTLIAGVAAPAVPDATWPGPFDGSCKVLSIVRTALGVGAAGVPAAAVVTPSAAVAPACQWKLGVYSSANTDTGTYIVTWVRLYAPSASFAQGGTVLAPVAAAVGQQYAP
jgi:hypothetical protein